MAGSHEGLVPSAAPVPVLQPTQTLSAPRAQSTPPTPRQGHMASPASYPSFSVVVHAITTHAVTFHSSRRIWSPAPGHRTTVVVGGTDKAPASVLLHFSGEKADGLELLASS